MINKNTHDDIYQHEQNLRNKAAGYVISRYLLKLKNIKLIQQNQDQRKTIFMNWSKI